MKLGRKFVKFAVFTVLFMLMSMAFAVGVAAMITQPTHRVNLRTQTTDVSDPSEVVVAVNIERLPYANAYGTHGIGWTELMLDIQYDRTRFELIPYSPLDSPEQIAGTDFSLWHDVNGNPAARPHLSANHLWHSPDTIVIRATVGASGLTSSCTPVMNDVVIYLRFRLLENAAPGNYIPFRWVPPVPPRGIGGGRCPINFSLMSMRSLRFESGDNVYIHVWPPATPLQPTHRINLVSQTPTVSPSGYVDLDIHLLRLPYADTVGRHYGFGWTDFTLDIHFDHTRFELVSHSLDPDDRVRSDFSTWRSVTGWPVHSPVILSVFPVGTNGTFRIWAMNSTSMTPVMSDVVLHLRFRVLENAAPGSNIVFSWDHTTIGTAGFCPITMPRNISRFEIYGPFPTDFTTVNVS